MYRSMLRWSFAVVLLFAAAPHAHAFATKCSNPVPTRRYVPCEIDKVLAATPANAYTDVVVTATFTHATAPPVTIYGYLQTAGSPPTFRFRFNPMTDGTWSYTFASTPAGYVTNTSGQTFTVGLSPKESGFIRRDNFNSMSNRIVYDCVFDGPNECPPESVPTNAINDSNGVDHPFYWGQTYYQIINNAATRSSAGTGSVQNMSWQTAISTAKGKGFRKFRMLVYPWDAEYNGSYVINTAFGPQTVAAAQSHPFVVPSGCLVTSGCQLGCGTVNFQQLNLAHFTTLDQIVNFSHTQNMGVELILFKDQSSADCGRTFSNNANQTIADQDNERYAKYVLARYAAYPNVTFSLSNEWQGAPAPYNTAGKWNTLATNLKPHDPYREHPRNLNLRLMTIHSHEMVSPDVNLLDATSASNGWMVHGSLQYSEFFNAPWMGSNNPPSWWGDEIRVANGASGQPMIDDEFGYLDNFDDEYGVNPGRVQHRRAMWGLATAGIYGSVGDTRDDFVGDKDITMKSDWKDRPEWNDFQIMMKFFTDQSSSTYNIPEFWRMRRRDTIYYNQSREAWLMGYTNRYFVLYDAKGASGAAITFTLPALGSNERYDVWRLDPTSTSPPSFISGLSDQLSTTMTINSTHHLPGAADTVFLIKAMPFP